MMLTAVGRASLRRLIAPSILPCVTPLLVCKVPSSSATLLKSAAAAIQTRPLSTTRCLAFPAATKKTTTKSKAKKKKPAPKKKVSKKKPAKKKLVAKKKTISPEKKAAAEKKGLKEQALLKGSPDKLPDTPWVLFVQSKLKGSKGMEETQQRMKDASVEFRRLSDTKLQELQETAYSNKLANNASYKAWVESHPPETILVANSARARLSRKYKVSLRKITDERLPKRPLTAYALFVKARWATGELAAEKASEAFAALASEWKSLPESQKQPYQDMAKSESIKYASAMKTITT